MRIVYSPKAGEFDPNIGPLEQHISTPFYPGLPMVWPGVPAEVPDEVAVYLLKQPGWKKARKR